MNILKEDHLSSLPDDLIQKAKHMSKVYEYIYCIENLLRLYLEIHLKTKKLKFSTSVLKGIEVRKNDESKHKWLSLRGGTDLFYIDFKDISSLITHNWELFHEDFPSQNWINSKLEDLTRYRNLIAHNSYIDKSDVDTIKAHFNLISRQLNMKSKDQGYTENEESFFIKGLTNSKIYTPMEIYEGINHTLVYPAELEVAPISVSTYFEQIGPFFRVNFENSYTRLDAKILFHEDSGFDFFDENVEYIKFQIGQHDIDGDGIDEIFICVQKYALDFAIEAEVRINIFKYFPPAFKKHSFRDENWEKIGSFHNGCIMDEPIVIVKGSSIYSSRNFRHYYSEWIYVDGEFVERGI
ncbi:MAG: hypothetical protein V4622_09640 [Bacteroidota bacterium]